MLSLRRMIMINSQIEILKNALLSVERDELAYFSSLPDTDAVLSDSFEKSISALNKKRKSLFFNMTKTMPRKIAIIFAAAIITLILMMSISAIRNTIIDFFTHTSDSRIRITFDVDYESKEEIEESYLPTYIPSEYSLSNQNSNDLRAEATWTSNSYEITFSQAILNDMSMEIDNENVNLTQFKIGSKNVYCFSKNNCHFVVWLENGYIFDISCHDSVSLEELKKIVSSTKIIQE